MEKNENDLTFFKLALEQERDPQRRMLLLQQIRDVKQEILQRVREERARVQRENENMQKALDEYEANKKN